MTDIIIIGGGTAGLTAAIYAGRAGKKVTLLEKESTGGQIVYSPRIDNYPGLFGISGPDYADALTKQAEDLGVAITYGEALAVTRDADGCFRVETDYETMHARTLILAAGSAHRKLGLENEEALAGCGVSYCAVCDGAFYVGKDAAVLGGGSTALTDALFLSGVCRSVTLIHRRDTFRAEAALVKALREKPNVRFLLSSVVTSLEEKERELSGIMVKNLQTQEELQLPVDGLFIAIGQIPQTEIFKGFVDLDDTGYIRAGEDCVTSRAGVFAAGDCRTKTVRQLTTAAADGAVAALAACRFID